jgi:3-methyladenine DNA glycosylase AlkD
MTKANARASIVLAAAEIRRKLAAHADSSRIPGVSAFFKTGVGEYGEGDVFIGVRVPAIRAVCRECRGAGLPEIRALLRSRVHEERALALLLLMDRFDREDQAGRRRLYEFYLSHTDFINNWDLVDCSAAAIVGRWLEERDRAPLERLARSRSIWERRIAIIATYHFIKRGEFRDTLRIADLLLGDSHDLIHKAVGWMLREVGKRNGSVERQFLKTRANRMPRTMLRYAIERFPPAERQAYLRMGRDQGAGTRVN